MATTNLSVMRWLTTKLPNFSKEVWNDKAPDIGYEAIKQKLLQNLDLEHYLLSTGDKVLVEAAAYDSHWGIRFGKDNKDILSKKTSYQWYTLNTEAQWDKGNSS